MRGVASSPQRCGARRRTCEIVGLVSEPASEFGSVSSLTDLQILSTARALTNLIGNGIATIVVSKMEGEFDEAMYQNAIRGDNYETQPGGFPVIVPTETVTDQP